MGKISEILGKVLFRGPVKVFFALTKLKTSLNFCISQSFHSFYYVPHVICETDRIHHMDVERINRVSPLTNSENLTSYIFTEVSLERHLLHWFRKNVWKLDREITSQSTLNMGEGSGSDV